MQGQKHRRTLQANRRCWRRPRSATRYLIARTAIGLGLSVPATRAIRGSRASLHLVRTSAAHQRGRPGLAFVRDDARIGGHRRPECPRKTLQSWQHSHEFLGRGHHENGHHENERRTWLVVGLTSAMMLAEVIGGTIFGSMALVADGWHMPTHAGA